MDRLDRIDSVLRQHSQPVVTTAEVAEEIEDVTARTVLDDLRLLQREGTVTGKEAGANTLVWWHEERVAPPRLSPEDHPDQSTVHDHAALDGADSAEGLVDESELNDDADEILNELEEPDDEIAEDGRRFVAEERTGPMAAPDEPEEEIEAAMDAVDLPGSGSRLEARREAFREILRTIRDGGQMGTKAPYSDVHESHETAYETEKSWRKNCAGPALSDLQDEGFVELVDSSRGAWAWAGGSE